jgi:adenosylcobinamide-phosphate synthase
VWEWAGKWAAWADDGLSWLPARITAVLLMGVAWCSNARTNWRPLRHQARQTLSPNSGWPMAAMALALGVRLGKPGVYTLNAVGRAPVAGDTAQAVFYAQKTIFPLVLLAFIAIVLITP